MNRKNETRRNAKGFRRIVREIAKSAWRYYSVPFVAFLLLLILLSAILILSYAGYRFAEKTWITLLFLTIFLALVCMLGGMWGMIVSAFRLKRRGEHTQAYFSDAAPAGTEETVTEIPASVRFPLRMEERAGQMENAVFLIAVLVLWLGMDWLLRFCIGGLLEAAWDVSFLTLLVTWFPAVRLARLIRAGYERIIFYKSRPIQKQSRKGGTPS